MKMFRFFLIAATVLAGLTSCKKDNVSPGDIDPTHPATPEISQSKDTTSFSSSHIAWNGGESAIARDLYARIKSQPVSLSSPKLIFVDMANLKANSKTIAERYQNGSVIVVIEPNPTEMEEFMIENSIVQIVPDREENAALYGFCRKGAYTVSKIMDSKEYEPSSTVAEPGAEKTQDFTEDDARDTGTDTGKDTTDYSEIGWYVKPFIDWVNYESQSYSANNTEWDGVATYNCQHTYNLKLYVHKVSGSKTDYIEGPFTVFANYSYKPVYVYPDQSYSPGDYYSFNATYGCETGTIFKGDNFEHKHGGIYVHITGAFLRQLDVRTYISGDNTAPTFVSSYEPIPGTDINTTNYSETKGWNIGGGVTGNYVMAGGKASPTASASFNWGYSNTSTVSYSVSDLAVENKYTTNHAGNGASPYWAFICQNLPKPKGDKGFDRSTPLIARSTLSCPTTWIWHTSSHKEGDMTSIGKLVTKFHPELGAAHNGYCVDGESNTYSLDICCLKGTFVVPIRLAFGTVRIRNTFTADGAVMHDISVKDKDGEEVFHSSGDFSAANPCEFSVAEGTYSVTMKVTDRNRITKTLKMIDPLVVKRRKTEKDIQELDGYIRFEVQQ